MLREFYKQRIKRGLVRRLNNLKIARMAQLVTRNSPPAQGAPVVFFKASTGIDDLSWNSGFHLLASWALRLKGIPVAYFACHSGMSHCVLGTNRDHVRKAPPCKSCVYQSKVLYTGASPHWFTFERDKELEHALENLNVEELSKFEYVIARSATTKQSSNNEETLAPARSAGVASPLAMLGLAMTLPLGALCLPGLRWILRIHHLSDDEPTRYLLREYILSAWNIAQKFSKFLDETNPRAVVVFNGQFYPEATARYIAQKRGIRVITHEVGLQPASAFFTDGEATAYPIHIPDEFELNEEQNTKLDEPHANAVFEDMFDWLDTTLKIIRVHTETLFVIRAHPDELRVRKASRETVAAWVEASGADKEPNVVFVAPNESLSSYELIQRSKFVMVYNSTIGLEASIMGAAVLCAGKARFTQYPTVFFPQTVEDVRKKMEEFLEADKIAVPPEFKRNARRFLYYQLFRTSLPFGEFLEPSVRTTQTRLKSFELEELSPENSKAIEAIFDGLLNNGDFLLKE